MPHLLPRRLLLHLPKGHPLDMYDLDGWTPIACAQREEIIHDHTLGKLSVFSSLTDPEGVYGSPLVYTEWGIKDEDRPVLRDYLTYDDERKPKKCTHYLKDGTE